MELDFLVFDEKKNIVPQLPANHPNHSYTADFVHHMAKAMRSRLGNIDAALLLEAWLKDHPAYEEVGSHELWFPTGPWHPPSKALISVLF